ncbi:unnamed protein product [Chilo suppressalis]|uniref:MYND-type domain-containing protein n=1 Tax=Chilo suppressalis TaxID=168631 RepID=A0ABN8L383_CHISP|nr:unnamed protein product [Chilo suppressalis]
MALQMPLVFLQDKRIYNAIENDDLSEVVIVIMNLFKENNILFQASEQKSEVTSNHHRSAGNAAYLKADYRATLEHYNKALLCAPKGSSALALAYSNRSALLLTLKLYQECLTDIERCLDLDCPPGVVAKLMKRKRDAEANINLNDNFTEHVMTKLCTELLALKSPRNPDIPCASTDINVVVDSGMPKVVTTKAVTIGTVLAIEQAYISTENAAYKLISCHYCQNVNTNMIPCDNCCTALFCNDTCKKKCIAEYHSVVCKLSMAIETSPEEMLSYVKAAIKLRNSFNSWEEFNEVSLLLGPDRIKISEPSQIYNGEIKFSILNVSKERHFTHGRIYNCAMAFAQIICCIVQKGSFFPDKSDDKINAIRSFSRVLMHIGMNASVIDVLSCVSIMSLKGRELGLTCKGIYPLIGKLRHSCNPNVLAIGLNNRIALLALQPMPQGTELNISYAGHWLDYTVNFRQEMLLLRHFIICSCHICRGITLTNQKKPNEAQIQIYNKLNPKVAERVVNYRNFLKIYNESVNALTQLSDLPFSEEYKSIYGLFRNLVLHIQHYVCPNIRI